MAQPARISRDLLAFAALAVREGRPGHAVQLAAAATSRSKTARGKLAQDATRVQQYLGAPAGLDPAEVAWLRAAGQKLTVGAAARLALDPPGRACGTRQVGGSGCPRVTWLSITG
jgi:hypothetical protein